jgi:hypothetical protein
VALPMWRTKKYSDCPLRIPTNRTGHDVPPRVVTAGGQPRNRPGCHAPTMSAPCEGTCLTASGTGRPLRASRTDSATAMPACAALLGCPHAARPRLRTWLSPQGVGGAEGAGDSSVLTGPQGRPLQGMARWPSPCR